MIGCERYAELICHYLFRLSFIYFRCRYSVQPLQHTERCRHIYFCLPAYARYHRRYHDITMFHDAADIAAAHTIYAAYHRLLYCHMTADYRRHYIILRRLWIR